MVGVYVRIGDRNRILRYPRIRNFCFFQIRVFWRHLWDWGCGRRWQTDPIPLSVLNLEPCGYKAERRSYQILVYPGLPFLKFGRILAASARPDSRYGASYAGVRQERLTCSERGARVFQIWAHVFGRVSAGYTSARGRTGRSRRISAKPEPGQGRSKFGIEIRFLRSSSREILGRLTRTLTYVPSA